MIISSDAFNGASVPVYAELEKNWRSYMHLDLDHIEAYFIKADPFLPFSYVIDKDVIWCQGIENVQPGILRKTLLALDCMQDRFEKFDYVLRTNLSSFFVFSSLLSLIDELPDKNCYFGYPIEENSHIGSGAGFILSMDVVKLLISSKDILWDSEEMDDVAIGNFLKNNHIPLIKPKIDRPTFSCRSDWDRYKESINSNVFQIRYKNMLDYLRSDKKVHDEEVFVRNELLYFFYGIDPTLQDE